MKILQAARGVSKHGHASHAARGTPNAVCEGSRLRKKRRPETQERDAARGRAGSHDEAACLSAARPRMRL